MAVASILQDQVTTLTAEVAALTASQGTSPADQAAIDSAAAASTPT